MRLPAASAAALTLGALATGGPVLWAAAAWALVIVCGAWTIARANIATAKIRVAPAEMLVAAGAGEWLRILVQARGRIVGADLTLTSGHDAVRISRVRAQAKARGQTDVRTVIVGLQRGVWTLDGLIATASDPFGLVTLQRRIGSSLRVTVYPRPAAPTGWVRPRIAAPLWSATRTAPDPTSAGTAVDGVRRWTPGDPISRIAWGPSARHGELLAHQLEDDAEGRLWLVVDVDGSVGPTLEELLAAAVAIAEDELAAGLLVGLIMGGGAPVVLSPTRGASHRHALLAALAGATAAARGASTPIGERLRVLDSRVADDAVVLLTGDSSPAWPSVLGARAGNPQLSSVVLAGAAAASDALRGQLDTAGIATFVVEAATGTRAAPAAVHQHERPDTADRGPAQPQTRRQVHLPITGLAAAGLLLTGLAAVRLAALLLGADAIGPAAAAWLAGVPLGILGVSLVRRLATLNLVARLGVGLLAAAIVYGAVQLGAGPILLGAPVVALVALMLVGTSAALTAVRHGARTGPVAAAVAVAALSAAIAAGDPAGLLAAWSGLLALASEAHAGRTARTERLERSKFAAHAERGLPVPQRRRSAIALATLAIIAASAASAGGLGAPLGANRLAGSAGSAASAGSAEPAGPAGPGNTQTSSQGIPAATDPTAAVGNQSHGSTTTSTPVLSATPGDVGPGFSAPARATTLDPAPGRGAAPPSAGGRSLPAGSSGANVPLLGLIAGLFGLALVAALVLRGQRALTPVLAWQAVERVAWLRGYRHTPGCTTGETAAALRKLAPSAVSAIDALARLREQALYGSAASTTDQWRSQELAPLVARVNRALLLRR